MLFKEIVDGRTHAWTDDGRRTPDIEESQKLTSCSGELIKRKTVSGQYHMNVFAIKAHCVQITSTNTGQVSIVIILYFLYKSSRGLAL